jgi:hypothetical protein
MNVGGERYSLVASSPHPARHGGRISPGGNCSNRRPVAGLRMNADMIDEPHFAIKTA